MVKTLIFALIFSLQMKGQEASLQELYGASAYRSSQEIELPLNDREDIRLSFGSCYGIFSHTSDMFETIVDNSPDLFVWLGDVAYVDLPAQGPMPIEYVKERFAMTKKAPGYTRLLEEATVIGMWDDHDFGTNDGGKHYPFKDQNRDIWLDFIGEPSTTERRI